MVLLQSTGIVKSDALVALGKLAEQLSVIFSVDSGSDVALRTKKVDVIYVINEVIKRISMV